MEDNPKARTGAADVAVADAGDVIASGLIDADGNAEGLTFNEDAEEAQHLIPVYSSGIVIGKNGKAYAVERCTATVHAPRTASAWSRSTALSYMATGLHDVRPRLLALVRWHEWSEMDACIAYGRRYLGTCKPQIDPGAIETAVTDALQIVLNGRHTRRKGRPTATQRAIALGIAASTFWALRSTMVNAYERRLAEATYRFRRANDDRPLSNGVSHTKGFSHRGYWREQNDLASKRYKYPGGFWSNSARKYKHPRTAIMDSRHKEIITHSVFRRVA